MIEIVDGEGVGSGKSFYVLTRVLAHIKRGGTVFASEAFKVYWGLIKDFGFNRWGLVLQDSQFVSVPSEKVVRLHENTPPGTDDCPVLIIVDEVQDQFDVKEHADRQKKEFFSWCTQSRHDNNDLILISQDALNIDARFRRLATFRITVRNTVNWMIPGMGSVAGLIRLATFGLMSGRYFVASTKDRNGKTLFQKDWIPQDKELFRLYESKSMKAAHKRGGGAIGRLVLEKVKTRSPMLKYAVIIMVVFCLGAVGLFVHRVSTKGLFGGSVKREERAKGNPSPAVAKIVSGAISGLPPSGSAAWVTREEGFRGLSLNGQSAVLRTEAGAYQVGIMTPAGFCVGIDPVGRVAHCRAPDGQHVYVLAVERFRAQPVAVVSPAPAAAPEPQKQPVILAANGPSQEERFSEVFGTEGAKSAMRIHQSRPLEEAIKRRR